MQNNIAYSNAIFIKIIQYDIIRYEAICNNYSNKMRSFFKKIVSSLREKNNTSILRVFLNTRKLIHIINCRLIKVKLITHMSVPHSIN